MLFCNYLSVLFLKVFAISKTGNRLYRIGSRHLFYNICCLEIRSYGQRRQTNIKTQIMIIIFTNYLCIIKCKTTLQLCNRNGPPISNIENLVDIEVIKQLKNKTLNSQFKRERKTFLFLE